MADALILKRNEFSGEDYDVLWKGNAVGRVFHQNPGLMGPPWKWHILFWTADNVMVSGNGGSCDTRDEAMAAVRKAWDALPYRPGSITGKKPPNWPWTFTGPATYGRPDGRPP
jgi:hypothetical protein